MHRCHEEQSARSKGARLSPLDHLSGAERNSVGNDFVFNGMPLSAPKSQSHIAGNFPSPGAKSQINTARTVLNKNIGPPSSQSCSSEGTLFGAVWKNVKDFRELLCGHFMRPLSLEIKGQISAEMFAAFFANLLQKSRQKFALGDYRHKKTSKIARAICLRFELPHLDHLIAAHSAHAYKKKS